jgi:hypothetical protein
MKGVRAMNTTLLRVLVVVGLLICGVSGQTGAEDRSVTDQEKRIDELAKNIEALSKQLQTLKEERSAEKAAAAARDQSVTELATQVDKMNSSKVFDASSWVNKFTLGGYGEIHANMGGKDVADRLDLHRLVLYLGYDFNDWIKFHSETELEHAFVSNESNNGELSVEQAYVDFLLSKYANVRAGRFLVPLGIINKKHEPVAFNGVERPFFDTYIIPTTWFSDGVGLFGSITPSLKYEAYLATGLDGSGFDAINGIREGRIEGTSSLHQPSFTGRLDYYPFAERAVPYGQTLRVGASTFLGGLNNGNNGVNPGIKGNISIYSGDFEYSISRLDFKGAFAFENISNAREIGNGTASGIFGWNLEGGYHFWPSSWKTGKLAKSDAVFFVRYDDFNTQYRMPAGIGRDPAGERTAWTTGISFYPIPNFVIKGDYQLVSDHAGKEVHLWNLGIGWQL